jgi:hypothetical protein
MYWDWNLNQIGAVCRVMDEVFQFVATCEEFPPRLFPPPATIMEETIDDIQDARRRNDAGWRNACRNRRVDPAGAPMVGSELPWMTTQSSRITCKSNAQQCDQQHGHLRAQSFPRRIEAECREPIGARRHVVGDERLLLELL